MKTIELRVSRWSHWFHMDFTEDAAAEIDFFRGGVSFTTDRKMVLLEPRSGPCELCLRPVTRKKGEHTWAIEFQLTDPNITKHDREFLRQMSPFGLTECEATVDGQMMAMTLPPIHRRSWPQQASPEEWVNLIEKRLRSSIGHPLPLIRPPDSLSINRYWVEAHRRVKETQPVCEERAQPKVQAACGRG